GLRHNWDERTPALSVGGVAISALCVLYGRVRQCDIILVKFCYRRPEDHLCWPFTKDGTCCPRPVQNSLSVSPAFGESICRMISIPCSCGMRGSLRSACQGMSRQALQESETDPERRSRG